MKKSLIILTIFTIFMLLGCEESSTESESESQIMFVYAYHSNSYWDNETDEEVEIENTQAWGVVFADPIPSFDYLKLGNEISNWHEYYPGYIAFGEDLRITNNFHPINVEVKTSAGTVKGNISLQDTIDSINLSTYESLDLGESFTISWTGSNADFYLVYCDYEWKDNNGTWHYTDLDTFVTGNSVTYPGTIFIHNGEIDYIRVYPYNGPLPKEGAIGNMTGDGSGFLYYERSSESGRYTEDIVVGTGFNKVLGKYSSPKYSIKEIRNRTIKNIKEKIGLL